MPGGSTHTIVFVRKDNGRCESVFTYANGESRTKELIEREPGRKYEKVGASFGEVYIINGEGLLELWDEQGRIETLAKAPR